MIQFPINNLLDEEKCYDYLKNLLHPDGFGCPDGHDLPSEQKSALVQFSLLVKCCHWNLKNFKQR